MGKIMDNELKKQTIKQIEKGEGFVFLNKAHTILCGVSIADVLTYITILVKKCKEMNVPKEAICYALELPYKDEDEDGIDKDFEKIEKMIKLLEDLKEVL